MYLESQVVSRKMYGLVSRYQEKFKTSFFSLLAG